MLIFICYVIVLVPNRKLMTLKLRLVSWGCILLPFISTVQQKRGIFPVTIYSSIAVFPVLGWKCSCT